MGRTGNYASNQSKNGNALWETSNHSKTATSGTACAWNGDNGYFLHSSNPVMRRGGVCYTSATYSATKVDETGGLFYFYSFSGGSGAGTGFRPVLNVIE